MPLRRSYIWLMVVPVLLVSAWLGARGLNADAIWLDEYYSIYFSGGAHYGPLTPIELLLRVASFDVWPPGYYFSLAGWSTLVGWSPVAGRILSWLFGLLSVCVVYRLARELAPERWLVAFAAAVLVAGSAFYINYFHELRGYTFHILLGCGASWLYWSLLHDKSSHAKPVGFVVALILLLYSHPVGLLWCAVIASYHLILMRHTPQWKRILLLFVIAGIAFIPWSIILLLRVRREIDAPRGLDPLLILRSAGSAYTNQLLVIAVPLCLLTLRQIRQRFVQFLWWWLVGVVLLTLAVDRFVSFLFHVRLIVAALPALLLLLAVGLAQIRIRGREWVYAGVLIVWLGMGLYLSFDPDFMDDLPGAPPIASNPGFESAVNFLRDNADPEDAVVFRLSDAMDEFWLEAPLKHYFYGSELHVSLLSPVSDELNSFTDSANYLWLAEAPGFAPDSGLLALQSLLASEYVRCEVVFDMRDMRLELYAHQNTGNCIERMATIVE